MSGGGLKAAPMVGQVVERDRTRLPRGMVESTTEYDYAELPTYLRDALEDWCDAFAAWDHKRT